MMISDRVISPFNRPKPNNIAYFKQMKPKSKWYNDISMLGSMLFFLPPIGYYGLFKSETIPTKWKKVGAVTLAMVGLVFLAIQLW